MFKLIIVIAMLNSNYALFWQPRDFNSKDECEVVRQFDAPRVMPMVLIDKAVKEAEMKCVTAEELKEMQDRMAKGGDPRGDDRT